ncbi:hypothetical protein P43SY_008868 [Pythium insidiosum]|uniref:4-nitrophenylphosphatase n=1 Tax=Pythium insidiosum TaxID=114742 RepID=A0AAD5QDI6_PYTIN|nr:hypothetical protein P43SY_008868 [Pythium insidiosum]
MMPSIRRLDKGSFRSWLSGLDAFLLDCDGVLWRGDAMIPGADKMIKLMRSLGKRVVFVTNNSTKTRDAYVKKLAAYGIESSVEDIVTSAWATVQYMKNEGIQGKVYYVGEAGLGQELKAEGYDAFGLEDSDRRDLPIPFTVDKDVKAVVVGLDRNISYFKAAYASVCVRQIPGCRFIGTNPDPTFPVDGAILPAGGSCVKFVECAVGRAPDAVVGKPSQDLLKTILATYNLDPARTCMVGDRLSTDIEFGRRGGTQTLLVLSGVTQPSELVEIQEPMQLTKDAFGAWIAGLDAFLLDCDGVLWRGDAPIAGAKEMIALLRSLGKRVVFVTNNSTKSRDTYVKKLASHGISSTVDDIVTSAWATVKYMKSEGIQGKVYYVGEAGLGQELKAEGYDAFGLEDGDRRDLPIPFTVDKDVKAVVVGLDRNLSYYKMAYASCCVRQNPGCHFIGTNPDQTFPVDGAILPGGGSLVKFLECAIGHPPEAIIGKPSQDLLKTILATYGLNASRTCMVGDRLSTDIEFGRRGGVQTLLVLSGVTHPEELSDIKEPMQVPDFVVESVDVLNHLHTSQ